MLKKILLIATGGTIASKNSKLGLVPQMNAEEILEFVPEIKNICELSTVQPFNLDSTNINKEHWLKLVDIIENFYNKYDGFLICHGTDTMAYTSSALSYLIENNKKPIVITGSQKPIDENITDAKKNLLDSIRYLISDKSYGINIVFNGDVISGIKAQKEYSKSYNAFSSINYPNIAKIYDDKIIFYIDEKEKIRESVRFHHKMNGKVFVFKIIPDCDAKILELASEFYDAVVIEAFGLGGLPEYGEVTFESAIYKWIKLNKKVVITTQVQNEGTDMSLYEVGKKFKEKFNIIEAKEMTLEAIVTKLMFELS